MLKKVYNEIFADRTLLSVNENRLSDLKKEWECISKEVL